MIDLLPIRRALISVSDKSELELFCIALQKFNIEIFSSGGTLNFLKEKNISVRSISELANSPTLLGGRVKTLHSNIHAGILADKNSNEHLLELEKMGIIPFDLVVVNFYPFEKVLEQQQSEDLVIENIDIGGPTMVRSAAKNFGSVAVVSVVDQYKEFINELENNSGAISLQTRRKLAARAFQRIVEYDSAISNYFNRDTVLNLYSVKTSSLRYGENPHQDASLYGNFFKHFVQIHGKELSYNNILDVTSAAELLDDLGGISCVIVKHNNPCGAASNDTVISAYERALRCDPISAFGGIVAFSAEIDIDTAKKLNEIFLEVIILPAINDEIKKILTVKKDRRIILYKEKISKIEKNIHSVPGGFIVQSKDDIIFDEDKIKIVTKRNPTEIEMRDLTFAWKVAKHVKSNAIVYAKDQSTIGIGAGQMSRLDSSRIAKMKALEFKHNVKGCVVASDAFFSFADALEEAVTIGASAVIQPGGSIRDNEVIEAANKHNITMVFTGIRHFKH